MGTNYIKYLCVVLLAVAGLATARAESFKVDGLYYNIISEEEKTVEVTYYYQGDGYYNSYDSDKLDSEGLTKYKGDQTIPEKVVYKGAAYTVAAIGSHAFDSCPYLTSLTLPASVVSIGGYAFEYCLSLASIDMPLVTSIGYSAFSGCTTLSSIDMPLVTSIEFSVFYGCTSLTSIDMPSVTSIGIDAFEGCTSLVLIDMPLVTSIEEGAFEGCTSLAFVDIPASVTSIGIDAFLGCGLTSVFCHWQEPLELEDDPFFTHAATLYVPAGTKSAYEAVYPWSEFDKIVEMYYSSIDEAKASAPTVTVIDGAIVIEGEMDMAQPVEVYSTGGQCVHRGTGTRIEGLPHGVYVVRVGQSAQKVVL